MCLVYYTVHVGGSHCLNDGIEREMPGLSFAAIPARAQRLALDPS